MDDWEHENTDSLAISRLDVISCGLGGAVLLGLVFSVVKHEPPATISSPPFILVEWTVESENADVFPLINAVIKPPGSTEAFDLPMEEFDPRVGRPVTPEKRQLPDSPIYSTGSYTLLGFSRFGDEEPIRLTKSGPEVRDDNESSTPVYQLMIGNPVPGKWKFQARYQNNRNARDLSDDHVGNRIKTLTTRIYTRSGRDAMELVSENVQFGFTNETGLEIEIPPYEM